jgi:transglutaminase/protease-like cytokinesis protein 3
MKHTSLIALLLFAASCFSQQNPSSRYRRADSIALAFPKNKYYFYTETAEELAQDLATETEKCRAIFRWIAQNVRYDYDTRNNREGQDPEVVYKHRKAVCAGYSNLFKAMCSDVKIDCRYVTGFAGGATGDDHAWNIVKLDGKWYIMDVTWAAGNIINPITGKYKGASYNEQYWMADLKAFKKDHQSEDPDWQRYIEGKYTDD